MKRIILLMLSGVFSISSAMADDQPVTPAAEVREPSPTQKWLELQRSGTAASPQSQPLSGEVMDKVHKRYLKNFEHPIPEFYEHDMPITH